MSDSTHQEGMDLVAKTVAGWLKGLSCFRRVSSAP